MRAAVNISVTYGNVGTEAWCANRRGHVFRKTEAHEEAAGIEVENREAGCSEVAGEQQAYKWIFDVGKW